MARNPDEDEIEDDSNADESRNCPAAAPCCSSNSPRSVLPLLKRVEELELSMRSLEDHYSPRSVTSHGGNTWSSSSARSSCFTSSGSKKPIPIQEVLDEIDEKGTLIDRVAHLENRLGTLSMHLHSGQWTPSQVPVLSPSPKQKAAEHVDESRPRDAPARQLSATSESGSAASPQPKLKRRHMIPHLLKNCLHPVASH